MELRELQVDDIFVVAKMISKIAKESREMIVKAVQDRDNINTTEFGLTLISSVFSECEDDLKLWLSSMAGSTKEEFAKMPAVALIEVVEALMSKEDIKDFFARAFQLSGKTNI